MISRSQTEDPLETCSLAEIRASLAHLYGDLDQAVADHGPVCQLSGRCCRFNEYGHTLFLSAPEAALLIADAPAPVGELDDGLTCPWQDRAGRCIARDARPLGCRVYFCDPSFQDAAPKLSEQFLKRLKELAIRHSWPWNYAPLHQHLSEARSQGRLTIPMAQREGTCGNSQREQGLPGALSHLRRHRDEGGLGEAS
jgi:hypothetical protein